MFKKLCNNLYEEAIKKLIMVFLFIDMGDHTFFEGICRIECRIECRYPECRLGS